MANHSHMLLKNLKWGWPCHDEQVQHPPCGPVAEGGVGDDHVQRIAGQEQHTMGHPVCTAG